MVKTTIALSRDPTGLKALFSPRLELRFALLAAMETCWVYVALALLSGILRLSHVVSPLLLFAAYWFALNVGHALPQVDRRWVVLQFAAIGLAVVTLLTLVRIDAYASAAPLDFTWLMRYMRSLFSTDGGLAAVQLTTAGVLYSFVRGLGFGQRPLTLWFVSFQFRLGIVVFFLLFLFTSFLKPYDAVAWVFVYFFLSLLAMALARVEESGGRLPLGPRWTITLLSTAALVIFLGLGVAQFFTLETATRLARLLAPVGALFSLLIFLALIPIGLMMSWVLELLVPLFRTLAGRLDFLRNLFPNTPPELGKIAPASPTLEYLAAIAKSLLVAAVVLGVGYVLARALHHRREHLEEDAYIRESISADEDSARVWDVPRRKQPRRRRRADSMNAESIRRIYAALAARAGDAGLPRRAAETPYEFLPRLGQAWPEREPELRAITEAYVLVHYGEHEADETDVRRVRKAWQQVEKRIREDL